MNWVWIAILVVSYVGTLGGLAWLYHWWNDKLEAEDEADV